MEIKKLREKTKLSQKRFSEKFGIPVKTLQKWEQHDSDPLPYLISLIQNEISAEEFIDVSKYFKKRTNSFEITNSKPYKNNDKIHPIHQNDVQKILETLKEYSEVKSVVVFGSSVEETCNYQSDIDIYVELKKDINIKKYNIDTPVDYWTNYTVCPEILKEIKKKGVVVYDSQNIL